MLTESQRERKRAEFRRWYLKHRAERLIVMRAYTKRWLLQRRYDLTIEEWEALLRSQNYRCALCGRKKRLQVDHDHRLGETKEAVRGAVCCRCNGGTFRLFERRLANGEEFWMIAKEYRALGLTQRKAAHLARYLR